MAHLTLRLLGGFEAYVVEDTPVDFPIKKARALLAHLAFENGKRQPREKLATLLWANSGEERARVNLRQTLKLLRKSILPFDSECIASDGDAIYLDPTHVEVDVWEFDRLCDEATPGGLARAAELYRGEFLEGFMLGEALFEDWLRMARHTLQSQVIQALRQLQTNSEITDDLDQSIGVAQRLLELDPLQEDVHRSLMQLYADGGDRILALRQYQTCRDVLAAELGLTPDEETERLREDIRRGHQSGDEVPGGEEEEVADVLPLPTRPSIAILPFRNLGDDPGQDYLADGLHFDIQATLIRVAGLFLIASGTVSRYRGKDVAPETAGREMGVRYILEGGVHRLRQRIQLTLQLTDVVSKQSIWAAKYDQALEDVATMQDNIATEVLEALNIELLAGKEARVFQSTLTNPQARECFYRALNLSPMTSKDGNAASRNLFEEVIRFQLDSPIGATYMAFSYLIDVLREWADSRTETMQRAVDWANQALTFGDTNGLAHVVLAYDHLMCRRHDEALVAAYKAAQLRPSCPTAIGSLANILLYCGHTAEAELRVRAAMRLSPIYPPWFVKVLAAAYRDNGDVERSISVARQAIEMDPSDVDARLILCHGYLHTNRRQQAQDQVREILAIKPNYSIARFIEDQPYKSQQSVDPLVTGLREAGLQE